MSGSPTETEVQEQWRNAVAILERARLWADDTLAGQLDTLSQSLEGEYTPSDLPNVASSFRAGASALISTQTARAFLAPVLFEYARLLGYGSGRNTLEDIMPALLEHFVDNSLSVRSRGITRGTPAAGGSNVGNGSVVRVTVDRWGENIESSYPEVKRLRCVADQNSGVQENAERFELLGEAQGADFLRRDDYGTGSDSRTVLVAQNAGQGSSVLRNGSFTQFASGSTPKFSGWTESSGSANVAQESAVGFRLVPGETSLASLRLNGDAVLSQTLRSIDPSRPYRYRVMLNKDAGSATGGTVTIRLGSRSASVTIAALGSGWQELVIALDENSYLPNFNEDDLDVTIEWASSSSGYLLVDDAILAPLTQVDGAFLAVVGGSTPFLLDDEFTITDTGGAAGTGDINYWLWRAGLGYLPSVASGETFTDPG